MKQYIDKATVKAEIERRINDWTIRGKNSLIGQGKDTCESRVTELNDLLSFLDTLEVKEEVLDRSDKTKLMRKCVKAAYKKGYDMGVLQTTNKMNSNTKEVNLEKEIQEAQRNYKTIEEYKGYPCTMYADDIEWIAKHFFELGLKAAQKGE